MASPHSGTAGSFLTALTSGNPFSHHRVTATGAQPVDVPTIHEKEFNQLVRLALRVKDQNEAAGVVVWGESGAGKSNLLRRLSEWAGAGKDGKAVLVNFLELQATPGRLHRAVLNAVVSTLTNGHSPPCHKTKLYQLLEALVRPAIASNKKTLSPAELESAFRQQVAALETVVGPSPAVRSTADLLFQFLKSAMLERSRKGDGVVAAVAVRRLSGDGLDEDEAKTLGLRGADATMSMDSADCIRSLALLTQLARAGGLPVILCFDQVHTLPEHQIGEVCRMLHDLNDHVRNALLILSDVQEELQKLTARAVISQATWDRLSANKVDPPKVTVADGKRILEARLVEFLTPFEGAGEVSTHFKRDPLFPLGEAWFAERFGNTIEIRPRRMIDAAKERWEELQRGLDAAPDREMWLAQWPRAGSPQTVSPPRRPVQELIDEQVGKELKGRIAQHTANPNALPPNADNLCGLTEALLAACGDGLKVTRPKDPSPYDLLVRVGGPKGEETVGVVFLVTSSSQSVTSTLGKLATDPKTPTRVLLVTDQRLPLPFGKATKAQGRNHYTKLKADPRFQHLELPAAEYAALEALDAIARQAGDWEISPQSEPSRPLKREEVVDSYRRADCFTDHPLLKQFTPPATSPTSGHNSAPTATPKKEAVSPTGSGLWVGSDSQGSSVEVPLPALPTHVAVVGAAGSGKTWLAKAVAEEAALAGVAVLAIDPQGDLVQFLRPSDRSKLSSQEAQRADRFRQSTAVRVLTPGTNHGERISLNPLKFSAGGEDGDDLLATTAANLVTLAKATGEVESQKTFVYQLLRVLTQNAPRELTLGQVAKALRDPEEFGLDDPDRFVKKGERERLARLLNNLEHGPTAKLFTGGRPLDLDWLMTPPTAGQVPLNVVYLNALSDDLEKQNFVASLAVEVYRWMIASGSSAGKPRLLFYLDEARDYLPAGGAQPPAKRPLLRLFAQGRKYGVACLVCTQSPRSVDYNVFSNCSTKLIGRLESAQDVDRVKEWFSPQGPPPEWLGARVGAPAGSFVGRWPGQPQGCDGMSFQSRSLFTAHEGAWSPERVATEVTVHAATRTTTSS